MTPNITSLDTERLAPGFDRDKPPGKAAAAESPTKPTTKPARTEPMTTEEIVRLKERTVEVLHTIFDPEIPVNIYELGLIYEIEITPMAELRVKMTLTSPGCPVAGTLPGEVERKIEGLPEVVSAKVDLVWEPPWDKDRMSDAAKLQLGMDDW